MNATEACVTLIKTGASCTEVGEQQYLRHFLGVGYPQTYDQTEAIVLCIIFLILSLTFAYLKRQEKSYPKQMLLEEWLE